MIEKLQEIADIMNTLDISPSPRVCILRIGYLRNGEWVKSLLEKNRKSIISEIKLVLKNSCSIYNDGTIVVLAPHETETNLIHLSNILQNNLQKKNNKEISGVEVYIGIGESIDSFELVGQSYQQAAQILAILPSIQHIGHVGYFPSCGIWTLLSSITAHDNTIARAYTNLYLNKLNKLKDSKEMKEP